MTQVLRAALTDQPIFLAEHEELVSHRSAGAIVGFVGMIRDRDNVNGSLRDIAGICSANGRVVGLMPHPEHAIEALTGPSDDGLGLFYSALDAVLTG